MDKNDKTQMILLHSITSVQAVVHQIAFVLTTLATRCQTSDNNCQKRQSRKPCRCFKQVAHQFINLTARVTACYSSF